ncbi:MAG: phosphoglucosamine mutase [Pontiellaceae bacterium]
MSKYFGTDGIRGKANEGILRGDRLVWLAHSIVDWLISRNISQPLIYIGRDTRISGTMMEYTLAGAFAAAGANVQLLGIVPTPAVSHAVVVNKADLGIMISASHNPFSDNGLKLFRSDGHKLSTDEQDAIELMVEDSSRSIDWKRDDQIGIVKSADRGLNDYVDFCKRTLPEECKLSEMHLVLDVSNGSMYSCAPKLFRDAGARVTVIHDRPNGININKNCGSQDTQDLAAMVQEKQANLGIAFDGDGDRCIAVDENGKELRGDQLLAICAIDLARRNELTNHSLVVTVMSNFGLQSAMQDHDIKVEVSEVGDRNVMAKMQSCSAALGGEDSGHVIFRDLHTTGDGLITALQLIRALNASCKPLSELATCIRLYPQTMVNVSVSKKPPLETIQPIQEKITWATTKLGKDGRVLIRYSGTESFCRVMVEGKDEDQINEIASALAVCIKSQLI